MPDVLDDSCCGFQRLMNRGEALRLQRSDAFGHFHADSHLALVLRFDQIYVRDVHCVLPVPYSVGEAVRAPATVDVLSQQVFPPNVLSKPHKTTSTYMSHL